MIIGHVSCCGAVVSEASAATCLCARLPPACPSCRPAAAASAVDVDIGRRLTDKLLRSFLNAARSFAE